MTLETLRSYTRFLTNTDTTTYSNTDLDNNLNYHYDQFAVEAIQAMDDWDFEADTGTASLVADQQEYSFPAGLLKIKRVEITYDGTNWYKAEPLDVSSISDATDTTSISNNFESTSPFFDLMDNSLFLYPIPDTNVTNGIKIWYEKSPTALSATSDTPTLPAPFHKGLCFGAAEDYYFKKENYIAAQQMESQREVILGRMKQFFNKRNQEGDYMVTPSYVDYDYGND